MREDYIRRKGFLEFLEAFFNRRTEVGKESILKRFYHDSFLARSREECFGAALGFHSPFRIST